MVMTSFDLEKSSAISATTANFFSSGHVDAELRRRVCFRQIGEQFGKRLVGFRQNLEQPGTGVGGVVKAVEAVGKEDVPAHLAGECGIRFPSSSP